jgi:hypothetical protein
VSGGVGLGVATALLLGVVLVSDGLAGWLMGLGGGALGDGVASLLQPISSVMLSSPARNR